MPREMNVSGHINVIRLRSINPYYVATILKSRFGQVQIERLSSGVSRQVNIGLAKIRSIKIPILPEHTQLHVEERYRQMSTFHDAAMEAKTEGSEVEYREKLTYAEQLLQELIEYVENTIRLGPQSLGPAQDT
jgi:restriction endonuclease S subunit